MTFEESLSLMEEVYRVFGLTHQDMSFFVKDAPWPSPKLSHEFAEVLEYQSDTEEWHQINYYRNRIEKKERLKNREELEYLIVSRAATAAAYHSGADRGDRKAFVLTAVKLIMLYSEELAQRYKREKYDTLR